MEDRLPTVHCGFERVSTQLLDEMDGPLPSTRQEPKPSVIKFIVTIIVFLVVVLALVAVVTPFLAGLAWSLAAHALRVGQFH
jgi:hypothetical protein